MVEQTWSGRSELEFNSNSKAKLPNNTFLTGPTNVALGNEPTCLVGRPVRCPKQRSHVQKKYLRILQYLLIIGYLCIHNYIYHISIFICVPFASKLSRHICRFFFKPSLQVLGGSSPPLHSLQLVTPVVSSPPGFHDKKPIWIQVRPSRREGDGNDQLQGAPLHFIQTGRIGRLGELQCVVGLNPCELFHLSVKDPHYHMVIHTCCNQSWPTNTRINR